MNKPSSSLRAILPLTAMLLHGCAAWAVTFTNDTSISPDNTNYDGLDIAVTNCTLTVDGAHSFASLQVLNGGNLTHTFLPGGPLVLPLTVTNEQQVLSTTNLASLSNANVVLSTIVVQDLSGLVTYTNDMDYVIGLDTNGMTALLLTSSSAIAEGSTNRVSYVFDVLVAAGLWLTVTGDVFVAQGGTINVDGKGYDGAQGPGAGRFAGIPASGSGAGHGGYGGQSAGLDGTGTPYDSIQQPVLLGSGGGFGYGGVGGAGGGSVKLVVGGNLRVEGTVSANGANGINNRSGGGSGGSIWLTCQNFSGAGVLSAGGGAGEPSQGGGGAGGRISLQFEASTFSGLTPARGGNGYIRGGAGTVYTRAISQPAGRVLVDNGGKSGASTSLSASEAFDLTAQGGAIIALESSQTFGNLLVTTNAWISLSNPGPTITVTGNATIQAGGGIIADGAGRPGGQGPGAGRYDATARTGGGGGYGGYGAAGGGASAYGGITYGAVFVALGPGSGGGSYPSYGLGGSGGGAIRLNVTGMLLLDGRISTDGSSAFAAGSGGGSGGSLWLTVGTLAGAGTVSANGGMGNGSGLYGGGGGGGGRVVIQYGLNLFFGVTSAQGAGGSAWGGAGTIYTKANTQSWGLVLADNGGHAGTNTSWPSGGGAFDLTIRNGASLAMPSTSQTIGNLLVGSNGWLYVSGAAGRSWPMLTISGNGTIQPGGGIIADGGGYSAANGGPGPGAGGYASSSTSYSSYVGGGGGFGGYGAASGGSTSAYGGIAYGPVSAGGPGSAGGTYGTYFVGGAGGGAVSLSVTGTLQVDGRISSAGGAGAFGNAGGGSGGGIALTVGTLAGSGVIAVNGGAGNGLGGGGGGGRIAVTYTANAFAGVMSAHGGGGYAWGGAGTIYTRSNSQSWGQVLADNGGQPGANTSWNQTGAIDLTVTGGAVVSLQNSQMFPTLLVTSNAWIKVSNQALTVTGNATVQAGGGITADSTGYPGGQGPGAGRSVPQNSGYVGGGGGHGGNGAASGGVPVALGGGTYGSVTTPLDRGSGGGTGSASAPGGAGGGTMLLNVTGVLLLNGRISADGGAGIGQGTGGGSSGSVWLTVGTLAGLGTISANGGMGNQLGGGGGGGRICVRYGVNAFEGAISAYGGGGYAWGGAGTIYTKANSQAMGQMVVDNGGHYGTNTPVAYLTPFDLTVRGGAVAYPASPYLLLSNLFITAGGSLTCFKTQTNLDVAVLRNATVDASGVLAVDGKGFAAGTGPGAGLSTNSIGSGAGYGGNGGASSVLPGGPAYGSAQQPVDCGSGGGRGWGPATGGSEGGGAIRLTVGGTLTVNGWLSAGGNAGLQDDGGGGSGGSVWLAAGALAGTGAIAADGGAGELYDGGGGGGGRVAIYTPINAFNGRVSAAGGTGVVPGQAGSIYYATTPAAPEVVSLAPSGVFTAAVSSAEVVFNSAVNPYSVAAPGVSLTAPGGFIVSNITSTALSPYRFQISFPEQTASGDYTLTVGPPVQDMYGQPIARTYTNTFTIAWAVVQGTVTDTNNLPVPGVLLQPAGGVPATTTDTNGNYVLAVPPAGTIQVVPSKVGLVFVPSSRTYADVTTPVLNENYLAVSTAAPALTTEVQSNSFVLSWYGIPGVTYQPLYSTNLVDWLPYDGALPGTNGLLQLAVPMDADPIKYFRVGASY